MAENIGAIWAELRLGLDTLKKDLKNAKTQLKKSKDELAVMAANAATAAGSAMTKAVTLPIMGAAVGAAKFAGDFEESINKITTLDDSLKEGQAYKELQQNVLNTSNELGIASTEIADSMYQAISAGADTADSLEYVKVASKAAIGGFSDTETAVDGLTTVLNAYGLKGKEAIQSVSDQMLMAQNFGKTTFGEMASSIGNVIPIAASLDVSTQELFASIATLTKNGIGTSEAVTGLKAAYSNIIKPSKQASDLASELGLEFNAAHLKSVGWAKFLKEVSDKTGGNADKMATLFGSVEALNSVTVLATTGSKDFAGALDAMGQSAGATESAFKTMDQGSKDAFGDLMITLQNFAISIGTLLQPAIENITGKVQQFVTWLNGLDESQKAQIIRIAGIVAAIGPLLLVGGKMVKMYFAIKNYLPAINAGFSALKTSLGFAKAGFAALTSPVGLVIAGVLALIAVLVLIVKHWDEIKEKAKALGDAIIACFINIKDSVINAWTEFKEGAKQRVQEIVTVVTEKLESLWTSIKNIPSQAWQWGADIINGLKKGIMDKVESAKQAIGNAVGGIIGKAKGLLGIHSPSKVFQQIGGYVSEGMAIGIDSSMQNAIDSVNQMSKGLISSATSSGSSGPVKHDISGVIRVEGVNSKGEMAQTVDIIMEELLRQVRFN